MLLTLANYSSMFAASEEEEEETENYKERERDMKVQHELSGGRLTTLAQSDR